MNVPVHEQVVSEQNEPKGTVAPHRRATARTSRAMQAKRHDGGAWGGRMAGRGLKWMPEMEGKMHSAWGAGVHAVPSVERPVAFMRRTATGRYVTH